MTTSAVVPMASPPIHHFALAHHSETVVLLCANSIHLISSRLENAKQLISLPTAVIVPQPVKPDQSDAIQHAVQSHITFPRLAQFSPSDQLLALNGDDKVLRVWKISQNANDGTITGLGLGQEVLIKHLPKRAALLYWLEPRQGSQVEELVVVDRFGDVRSFEINPSVTQLAAKQQLNNGHSQNQDEMDSPSDRSMQIISGHVSMVINVAFIPPSAPTLAPPFIITSDRDEHIRISRWGPKKAAHVIERYLLGSDGFVGAIKVIKAQDGTNKLLSSDGGKAIRVWNLHECEAGPSKSQPLSSSAVCESINTIVSVLTPHVLVREREEKRRESLGYHPGGKKGRHSNKRKRDADKGKAKQEENTKVEAVSDQQPNLDQREDDDESPLPCAVEYSKETNATVAITKIEPFESATGDKWLLVAVEGSTAFFHLPLSAVLDTVNHSDDDSSKQRDISSVVQVTRTNAPILDLTVWRNPTTNNVQVWVSLDTRPEFYAETKQTSKEVEVFEFNGEKFVETTNSILSLIPIAGSKAESELKEKRPLLESGLVNALSLYPALTTWPKVEAPSSAEMLALRNARKGRLNHTLGANSDTPDNQAKADETEDHQDPNRQKQVKRMVEGRRAKGREKNRAALGLK